MSGGHGDNGGHSHGAGADADRQYLLIASPYGVDRPSADLSAR